MAKSVGVNRRLLKDFKQLIEAQTKNEFHFYIKPEEQENKPWTERIQSRSDGVQRSASL